MPGKSTSKLHGLLLPKVLVEVVETFRERNKAMLYPKVEEIPKLPHAASEKDTPDMPEQSEPLSFQTSPEIRAWFRTFSASDGAGPVTMLNLLRYASKEKYIAYVKAFGESFGPRFGWTPKIVGEVFHPEGEESGWDGITLVQYPSITHFADLLASDELARIDRKYKVGALKDTGLL